MRIEPTRIAHMHGVAEYMSEHAPEYDLDPDFMYLLGYIHDIGYIHGKKDHESIGGMLIGLGTSLGECVFAHGMTPQEYVYLYGVLTEDIPKELILLWEADMMVDQGGAVVGFATRLSGIKDRLGADSKEYKKCTETVKWLEEYKKALASA